MNTRIHPGVAVLIIVAVLGAVFGIMWYQSEAPKLNRLPRPTAMGPPAGRPKPTAPIKPTSHTQKNNPHKAAEHHAPASSSNTTP